MADEPPDSLDGWVPVREGLFAAPERRSLRFLVAWNAAEAQFAVTCHDRAAQQRRRAGARPGTAGPAASWAGLLPAAGLRGAHRQLAALWPPLERCFPALPPELDAAGRGAWGLGLWALVRPRAGPGEAALQELCARLERYLGQAADGCGGAAVRDALFPGQGAEGAAADCESTREFRERALRARRDEADARLRQALQGHEEAGTLVALTALYREEDQAYQDLVATSTAFFQHRLQPLRGSREVAASWKCSILKSLEEEDLGPRRVAVLQREAQEWARRAEEAVAAIQDITVEYFQATVSALAGMQKQMEQDERRFGQAAWATAVPRLEKLRRTLAQETLQLLRARELCLGRRQAALQGQMEDLAAQGKSTDVVDDLEARCYEAQLALCEVKLEMLNCEEALLAAQLGSARRLMRDLQEEVVYYDPCESPEELRAGQGSVDMPGDSAEVEQLRRQCRQLETRRGHLCARRAQLRNRKERCREAHRLRLRQAAERAQHLQQHHGAQAKRDKRKEEEHEREGWVLQERQKTLRRLRAFREKRPSQSAPTTPRPDPGAATLPGGPGWQPPSPPGPRPAASRTAGSEAPHGEGPASQGCPAATPEQTPGLAAGQTHCRASQGGSPPPPPPPPPPLPPPPPGRTPGGEDGPCPLLCHSPAQTPPRLSDAALGPGSMDEVLASLRLDRAPLQRVDAPAPRSAVNQHILAAIRQGVKLRKAAPARGRSPSRGPPGDLERSIKAALQRIQWASADSEDSGEEAAELSPGEWDH